MTKRPKYFDQYEGTAPATPHQQELDGSRIISGVYNHPPKLPPLNYDDIPNFEPPAAKHDTQKPQYSLIPLDLLLEHIKRECAPHPAVKLDLPAVISHCHALINSEIANEKDVIQGIKEMMDRISAAVGLAPACMALQYGVVKYARDNWKQGFGGDYKRLLEATIRHSLAVLEGKEYDGEALPGFPEGNLHIGAVYFSLMVALNEAHIHFNGKALWSNKQKEKQKVDLS